MVFAGEIGDVLASISQRRDYNYLLGGIPPSPLIPSEFRPSGTSRGISIEGSRLKTLGVNPFLASGFLVLHYLTSVLIKNIFGGKEGGKK